MGTHWRSLIRSFPMDFILVATVIAFFVAAGAYAAGCDRL